MDFADQIADENTVGGIDVLAGAQIGQFADNGFDGFVFPNPINVGVVEYGAFSTTHVGFRDDSSTSRIVSMRNCTGGTCSTVTTFGTPATHATMTSGLLAGDLMDGQDSTVTTTDGRRDRSGYGREAALHMWRANNTTNLPTSLSDAVSSMLPILNMSVAYAGNTNCSGQSVTDEIINDLFEAGTVTFFAAGNNGHSSTTDCVVEEPGSALGAFVVGAHDSADEADVRGGAIESFSDRGGTTTEGFRSIIDLTAAGCRLNGFTTGGGYGPRRRHNG